MYRSLRNERSVFLSIAFKTDATNYTINKLVNNVLSIMPSMEDYICVD